MMAAPKGLFDLIRPCPKCPFRSDVEPYLREGRVAEIATEVQGGAVFYCHQTTVDVDEDSEDGYGSELGADENTKACAGSLILMEKSESPNQAMRIAERLGLYDSARLDMKAPVHGSWIEMQAHFADDEVETCEIVNENCTAPAGYAIGGGVVSGTESAEFECYGCGRPVCGACSTERDGQQICDDCEEDGE